MSTNPFVLRSVHFPPELDDELRQLAFDLRRPKADLIRSFIGAGLVRFKEETGRDRSRMAAFVDRYDPREGSQARANRDKVEADKARLRSAVDDQFKSVSSDAGGVPQTERLHYENPSFPSAATKVSVGGTDAAVGSFLPLFSNRSSILSPALPVLGTTSPVLGEERKAAIDQLREQLLASVANKDRFRRNVLLAQLAELEAEAGHRDRAEELRKQLAEQAREDADDDSSLYMPS